MITTLIHRNQADVVEEILDRSQIVAIFQGESEHGNKTLGIDLFSLTQHILKQKT